ncbi:hypothetical protein JCGZ_19165 [Jatropha curcas]|uniref:Uncharacterized protein n=1 Tax=Jatropha curcas TaxID=180498 RepID=A0A067LAR4_JATCU|nr:hypothetical protein JCGZ_19165 [Jatropha curcas]
MTRPVSHGMKLREFMPNTGTSISLQYDLSNHLCWGTTEAKSELWCAVTACATCFAILLGCHTVACSTVKSVKRGKSGGNADAAKEWFDRLPIQVQDHVREASFGHFIDTLPGVTYLKVGYKHVIELIHVPPLAEFNPFVETEQLDRDQGDAPAQVSIADYNEVWHLYEAARLKLAAVKLSDEHISRANMKPPTGRGCEF